MNYRKKAIEFLLNTTNDEKEKTLIQLAATHPTFLVRAYQIACHTEKKKAAKK